MKFAVDCNFATWTEHWLSRILDFDCHREIDRWVDLKVFFVHLSFMGPNIFWPDIFGEEIYSFGMEQKFGRNQGRMRRKEGRLGRLEDSGRKTSGKFRGPLGKG